MADSRRVHRRISIFSCLLAVLLLLHAATHAADAPPAVTIPPELEILMAGWEDNFSRIHTLQAQARTRVEDPRFLACKDLDNRSYPDQNADIRIWGDGAKFRTDVVYDRMLDIRNNKVHYNLPFGEYAMPTAAWEQKRDEILRQHGVLQTTTRFMEADGKAYNYRVEGKDFTIDPAGKYFFGPNACEWLWKGTLIGSRTFPEYVRSKAKLSSMRSFTVEDLGGGRYAVHHNFVATTGGREVPGQACVVIDATKGYTVQSIKREVDGQVVYEGQYEYANTEEVWVLVGANYMEYDWAGKPKKIKTAVSLSVDVKSLQVNQAVDPKIFTVESLDIQKGSLVRDSIAGKSYLYDDVPIRLKTALKAAQNMIERPQEERDGVPAEADASAAGTYGSRPSGSPPEPVPPGDLTDTHPAWQPAAGTARGPTLAMGIVVGAVLATGMMLFWRMRKSGGQTDES